ncbi:MAG: hypothetical protein WB779_04290, partial [Ignavibacteriaceae bacterium]
MIKMFTTTFTFTFFPYSFNLLFVILLAMKKLKGLARLLRFELPFSAGVCVVMGQLFALGKFASVFVTASGFFSVFLISASIL